MSEVKENKFDMLHGPLIGKIVMFAIPIALTSTLQQLFNAADIIVCGRFVGKIALAAVGANSQIINLFINSFLGLSIGANVMIANYIGAGKNKKIYDVVHTSMTFSVAFGIFLMIAGLFISKNVLQFLGTPDDILEPATLYLRIIFMCVPFIIIYNFGAAILRSIGDTKRPLIILTITGVVNLVLNVILVVFFHLEVAGVAIATAVSNVISAVVVVILLINEKSVVKYDITKWMIVPDALFKIMRVGIPTAVQGMVFSISNLCVQSAINSLGTITIAANTAALNIESFPYFLFTAFSSACLTFMSQNYGAGDYERCKKVHRYCLILGVASSFVFAMIIQIFAVNALMIFTTEQEVIDVAMHRIRIATSTTWIQAIYETSGSGLRVLKHPILPTIMVTLGAVVLRLIWIFTVFPFFKDYFTVVIIYPISWMVINIGMVIAYNRVSGRMIKT